MCSARVDWFGEIEAPQPRKLDDKHPVVQKAAQVMIVIGEKYAKGEIEQGDKTTYFKMRDQLMKGCGVNTNPPGEGTEHEVQTKFGRPRAQHRERITNPKRTTQGQTKGAR